MDDQLGTCDLNPEPHSWATHVQQEHHFRPSRWRPLPAAQPTELERQAMLGFRKVHIFLQPEEAAEVEAWLAAYEREYPKEKA